MNELIRKKDALDALMAERKHLLANGQKGAEHVLTHYGYNVIDELPPVQPDVPDTDVGDMISREDAIDAVCTDCCGGNRDHDCRFYPDCDNLKSIKAIPPVQPKRGKWIPEYNTTKNGYYRTAHYCSCCKFYYTTSPEEMNFCPNCGAKMERNEDGTDL